MTAPTTEKQGTIVNGITFYAGKYQPTLEEAVKVARQSIAEEIAEVVEAMELARDRNEYEAGYSQGILAAAEAIRQRWGKG